MTQFSDEFRASRQQTIAQLDELADQFETGNRRGMKGKMTGAVTAIGGVAMSVGVGAMTGGASIIPMIAAKALMGAKVASGIGALVGGGFSIGAGVKNHARTKELEGILRKDRQEMERLRKELESNVSDISDEKMTCIGVLYTMYSLGALGMSIPEGKILENANTIHAIMQTREGTPLADIDTDKVLGIVQGFDIPALRSTFDAISVPGADSAIEAFGEMMFDSIVDFAGIAMLPFNAVMLGLDAHKYRKQDYKKAADLVREIASNMQQTTQEMVQLQIQAENEYPRSPQLVTPAEITPAPASNKGQLQLERRRIRKGYHDLRIDSNTTTRINSPAIVSDRRNMVLRVVAVSLLCICVSIYLFPK